MLQQFIVTQTNRMAYVGRVNPDVRGPRQSTMALGGCARYLVACPSETVRSLPGFDAAHDFERMQIYYGDFPVRRAGHVGARPIGLHKNSLTAISHF